VIEIAPAADPASRSYTVKIDLPPSPPMRSGLFGSARFIVGRKDVLTVPDKSIVRRGQLTGVYAVDGEGVARLRLIKTGKGYGDRMEVLSGLTDGERIVIDGVGNVTDGGRLQ
jgi:multidrug efflux pump subunit AcrA (membrane-fusion protein)